MFSYFTELALLLNTNTQMLRAMWELLRNIFFRHLPSIPIYDHGRRVRNSVIGIGWCVWPLDPSPHPPRILFSWGPKYVPSRFILIGDKFYYLFICQTLSCARPTLDLVYFVQLTQVLGAALHGPVTWPWPPLSHSTIFLTAYFQQVTMSPTSQGKWGGWPSTALLPLIT